jgi:hypothetical protein
MPLGRVGDDSDHNDRCSDRIVSTTQHANVSHQDIIQLKELERRTVDRRQTKWLAQSTSLYNTADTALL